MAIGRAVIWLVVAAAVVQLLGSMQAVAAVQVAC